MKEQNLMLQIDIIRMYTYYALSVFHPKNMILSKFIRLIELTVKKGIDEWEKNLKDTFKSTHPCLFIHNEIINKYSKEEYIENIKKVINIVKDFDNTKAKEYNTLNSIYDDSCIDKLATCMMIWRIKISDLYKVLEDRKDNITEDDENQTRFLIGCKYYEGVEGAPDYEKAIKEWEKIQDKFPLAKYKIANCYYFGKGVQKDYNKAFELYSSLKKSLSQARYMVGSMYYHGYGVEKNYEKAYEELSILSNYDYCYIKIKADYYVGMMLMFGRGIKMDKEKAMELLDNHFKSGIFEVDYEVLKTVFKQYYSGNN